MLHAFVLITPRRLFNETPGAGLAELLNRPHIDKSLVPAHLPFQLAVEPLLLLFSQLMLRS